METRFYYQFLPEFCTRYRNEALKPFGRGMKNRSCTCLYRPTHRADPFGNKIVVSQ